MKAIKYIVAIFVITACSCVWANIWTGLAIGNIGKEALREELKKVKKELESCRKEVQFLKAVYESD